MNYRILIHALILIFIIHIVIINLDYSIHIGKKIESFDNKKIETNKENKSLNFLLENKDNDNEFIKKMKELSNSLEKTEKTDKDVIPSNGYLNNENTPNFESNVEDTSKYYNVQNNYDNLNENQLQSTSLEDLNQKSNNIVQSINKVESNVRESKEKPTTWEYNNELAMNGGVMNGIIGFDGLESQYSNFGAPLSMKNDNSNTYENIPHDDLRKPVVVN